MRDDSPDRHDANLQALQALTAAEPVLIDVQPAIDVVPGMQPNMILTSGPKHDFDEYFGPQRNAILYAAIHEGLAEDLRSAEERFRSGELVVDAASNHGVVGSSCGVHYASSPVLVVENRTSGNRAFCGLYEKKARRLLAFGIYDSQIAEQLALLSNVIGPTLSAAIRRTDGIPLKPVISRALRMGDEVHSRTLAATTQLTRELILPLYDLPDGVATRKTLEYLLATDPFFLRVSLAAAKATADAAHGLPHSSIVTGMVMSCRAFAIRISGLADTWISCELPEPAGRFFDGYSIDDVVWSGGESIMVETVGLGAFAQASAFALVEYQGGDPLQMARTNEEFYDITIAEHPDYAIPYFGFRGTPTGIDIFRVVETGIRPGLDIGYTGGSGVGQIGAGMARAPLTCFEAAVEAYNARYPDRG